MARSVLKTSEMSANEAVKKTEDRSTQPMERRWEPRVECSLPAEVAISGRPIPPVHAIVRELSACGLQLRSTTLIDRSSAVRIKLPGLVVFGNARYSNKIYGGFESGIEITGIISRNGTSARLAGEQILKLVNSSESW
ncbi:MAG TPA: hypothetical protein VKU01_26070 [Bryobacteraceae bacterium]|nr:hypothetical protein [Bryobacteraceae bacterium]